MSVAAGRFLHPLCLLPGGAALAGLHRYGTACRPGKAQPPPGIEAGMALGCATLARETECGVG
ncbi:hypothetical protein EVG17_03635 [Klebsiella pneumoniae]|nr:hypothetical protein EVG17_03635 [Klebsiella pneumoniae]